MNISPREKDSRRFFVPVVCIARERTILGIGDVGAVAGIPSDWAAGIGFKLVQLLPINENRD